MNTAAPNWFGRNWKWFVPVGCLTLLLILLAGVAALVYGIFGMIKQAEPYQHALAAAQSHPALQQSLGTPLEPGLLVMGNIEVSGAEGSANLSFPVHGPRGEATVYVTARKVRGEWQYDALEADTGRPPRIDLQPAPEAPPPAP